MSKSAAQRQRESRQRKRDTLAPKTVTDVTKSERDKSGVTPVPVDGMCYNRHAVPCREFGTRPEPLSPADEPIPKNRGRYKRDDGTVYQFDCRGKSFECQYPYKDEQGKPHLSVYETVADVRKAGGAWT